MTAHIQFVGHLGGDAETKKVEKTTVTNFSVAVNNPFKKDDPPTWYRCALWGDRGKAIDEFLVKGKQVFIVGRLEPRDWEDDDGLIHTSLDVRVDDCQLLGGSKSDEKKPSKKNGKRERRADAD